jgi:hypothetical protein
MRKMLFLEPGIYRFEARYSALEGVSDAEIRWDLQCISAAGTVGKWFIATPVRRGNFAQVQDFNIDKACPNQLLIMQAAGGSNQLGAEFTLRSVDITSR